MRKLILLSCWEDLHDCFPKYLNFKIYPEFHLKLNCMGKKLPMAVEFDHDFQDEEMEFFVNFSKEYPSRFVYDYSAKGKKMLFTVETIGDFLPLKFVRILVRSLKKVNANIECKYDSKFGCYF